jgi:hypothetical protein
MRDKLIKELQAMALQERQDRHGNQLSAELMDRAAAALSAAREGALEEAANSVETLVLERTGEFADADEDDQLFFHFCEQAAKAIRALKSAPNEMAEMPDTRRLSDAGGTVRVPREPTMGHWDDFCAVHHVPFDKFIVAYKAMLAAAPSGGRDE